MASTNAARERYTIIVEHLDPELEDWQALEYKCVTEESKDEGWGFLLSGLNSASETQQQLGLPVDNLTESNVESIYPDESQRRRVCLLDPKAKQDLSPGDGELFDAFLFGGILGDDPPRDRTGDLRRLGFPSRRLGTEQMTTDTAARVTRMVIRENKRLEDIPFVDRPDVEFANPSSEGEGSAIESVSMPFRYVRREDGTPVMPKGMVELLAKDAEKDILDLL